MEAFARRALASRLWTARLARRLYLANMAVAVADGRELRANAGALRAEARLARAVAHTRIDAIHAESGADGPNPAPGS